MFAWMVVAWSAGCKSPSSDSADSGGPLVHDCDTALALAYLDADGDGYGTVASPIEICGAIPDGYVEDGSDCDDTTAERSPGVAEACNGIDDDCDGAVDESGALGGGVWYRDGDVDGYGDPLLSQFACTQPPGTAAEGTDCDDSNEAVHPDAAEVCNGLDDDCNDVADDDAVDAPAWFPDGDGDAYGDPGDGKSINWLASCEPIGDRVLDNSDCDDGSADVNPSVDEVCANGVDDNCDGQIDEGC